MDTRLQFTYTAPSQGLCLPLWVVTSPVTLFQEYKMAEGTIKRLTDKGFGFIDTGTGKDMFFHMSNVEGVRFDELREGQKVNFNSGEGPKGPRAENVRLA